MEITLNYLLSGTAIQIKGESFLSTEKYVRTFITDLQEKGYTFRCFVGMSEQAAIVNDEVLPQFTRVLVHAVAPNTENGFRETINMSYILDANKPGYKYFKGWINQEGKLIIPGIDYVITGDLEPATEIPTDFYQLPTKRFIPSDWTSTMNRLIEQPKVFLGEFLDHILSQSLVLNNGLLVKVGAGDITTAYSDLFYKRKTLPVSSPNDVTFLDFYNAACSSLYPWKGDMCVAEKTFIIGSFIKNYMRSHK